MAGGLLLLWVSWRMYRDLHPAQAVDSAHFFTRRDEAAAFATLDALAEKLHFRLSREDGHMVFTLIGTKGHPLTEAEAKGLLQRDLARAWPTDKGFDFLSDLQALFLSD